MEQTLFEERKQNIYNLICHPDYVPMKAKELAMLLGIPKSRREELQEVLDALVVDGKIELSARGKYGKGLQERKTGVFTAHAKGFGFLTVEGEADDYYVAPDHVNTAMQGDQVQFVEIPSSGQRREARIIKILERGCKTVVGTYERSGKGFGFVRPDDRKLVQDVFVPNERSKGAVDGHKVVVELTSYGDHDKKPEGKIIEILGHINDPGVDILSIVKAYDLPEAFPEKVLNQAERVAKDVTEADRAGRLDLRDWQMVTIDGEDAKDLDDAVSVTTDGDQYILGVHIADVSNYVQEHSALDWEALKRGTSVYLVDRVIPMLPHTLSNGICSLNQGQDRLALSCIMRIDKKGKVLDYKIAESVINVDRRMTYTAVNQIVTDRDPEVTEIYKDFVPMFFQMKELADILRKKRRSRGSIDFDFPETKVILDGDGNPVDIKPYERNAATRIIEDFMLAANETVASDYYWQSIPFLYRIHEAPDKEKVKRLSTFIHNFGYHIHIGTEELHPKEFQKLLDKIEDTPVESLISRLTLRSMKQAKYAVESIGHFGLAAPYYCHFTSPIRRYPDLQIHRIIKDNLRGRMSSERMEHYEQILPNVAKETSRLERRADEAERETVKQKKVAYMEQHIGEEYEGVISGVTQYGCYVELPNTVEGLVHISTLPGDYFIYQEDRYELVGERTGMTYKLGQTVKIKVVRTDLLMRTIDFVIV